LFFSFSLPQLNPKTANRNPPRLSHEEMLAAGAVFSSLPSCLIFFPFPVVFPPDEGLFFVNVKPTLFLYLLFPSTKAWARFPDRDRERGNPFFFVLPRGAHSTRGGGDALPLLAFSPHGAMGRIDFSYPVAVPGNEGPIVLVHGALDLLF